MRAPPIAPRRTMAVGAVLALHAVALLLLLQDRIRVATPDRERGSPSLDVFLVRPRVPVEVPLAPAPHPSSSHADARRPDLGPVVRAPASPGAIAVPAAPAGAPPGKHVDWLDEAARVARSAPPPPPAARCEDTDRKGSLLPRCTKKPREFEWKPEEGRFGIDGLLPYVRLGKRCVVGLGFFGCGFGGPPPTPDGHLLDGRDDPDRPRSSVPDVPR